jgi:broad specificity phosphatase PhoE
VRRRIAQPQRRSPVLGPLASRLRGYSRRVVTLVLTRHGATDRSEPEQHLGQRIDIPLSESGRAAAEKLGRRLAGVDFRRVISSPLVRAQETARAVASAAVVETDPRLAEMDYGRWEGLTYEQIEEKDADLRRVWEADPERLACPGGESGGDVARRVRAFLADLIADPAAIADERPVLAVAHSTTNRILLAVALGVPVRDYRRRFKQDPANLTVLRFASGNADDSQLLLANDMAHVKGVRGATWD